MQEPLPFSNQTTDNEILINCRNFQDALRMSLRRAGKSAKVVALELQERGHKIDEAILNLSLSENPSQKKNFPSEAIDDFIELTTDIPRRYLALRGGYALVRLKSSLEIENEQLRTELAEERKKNEIIAEFMKSTK